jgi:TonB family protein
MISALVNSLLPLTLLMLLMLMIRQPLRKSIDATTVYNLWLVIPLSLLLYLIPLPWQHLSWLSENWFNINALTADESTQNLLQRYLVSPSANLSNELSLDKVIGLWFCSTWALGFTLLVGYWTLSQHNYRKALKLTFLVNSKYQCQLNQSGANSLSIAQSSHIHSPILIGLFKQTLVIPEDFDTLYSNEQQELIISHEVCHFSHHHMWTNQLALMLLALFWFNPLAWRAYSAFRQDQEHSCDQVVLSRKHTQSRIQYCKALVLAAETSPPNAFTLLSFKHSFKQNGEQHFMFNRIKQIKQMSAGGSAKQTITKIAKLSAVTLISSTLLAGVSYAGYHLHQDGVSKTSTKKVVNGLSPIMRIEPKYPVAAAKAGTEGSVVLQFTVETDGLVSDVNVVKAVPENTFDKVAITALKQWRYDNTDKVHKDLLVQLDFVMSQESAKPVSLIERIQVNQ